MELMVVMAVIALLVGLLVPAVQSVRETSRRMQCSSHLHQIAVATQNYESTYTVFPGDYGADVNPLLALLPFVERSDLYATIMENTTSNLVCHVPVFSCPTDPVSAVNQFYAMSYFMNDGNGLQRDGHNGMFHGSILPTWQETGLALRTADISDGLSNTAAFGECLAEEQHRLEPQLKTHPKELRTAWYIRTEFHLPTQLEQFAAACQNDRFPNANFAYHVPIILGGLNSGTMGYHHVLPPNAPSCRNGPPGAMSPAVFQYRLVSASSLHRGGAHIAFADGAIRFMSNHIDRRVWSAIGSRDGGESDASAF